MTRFLSKSFICLLGLSALIACEKASEESIPVLSLEKGKTVQKNLSPEQFKKTYSPLFQNLSREVSKSLEEHVENENNPWSLSRVTVGLAAEAELDVEVAELDAEAEIELRFQKR